MRLTRDLRRYRRAAGAWKLQHGAIPGRELLRLFGPWRRSFRPGRSPLDDARPWVNFGAQEHLERILRPDAHVFEWGSGGSTLFLLSRVETLVTVEHDPGWFERVSSIASRARGDAWTGLLVAPEELPDPALDDPSRPDHYVSSDEAYRGRWFRHYAESISSYPDARFDLVLVDGRARPSCVALAIDKLTPHGHLLLDDADRETYATARRTLEQAGFRVRRFDGPRPYNRSFSRTEFWQRRPSP